jgi:hypothetical protein
MYIQFDQDYLDSRHAGLAEPIAAALAELLGVEREHGSDIGGESDEPLAQMLIDLLDLLLELDNRDLLSSERTLLELMGSVVTSALTSFKR